MARGGDDWESGEWDQHRNRESRVPSHDSRFPSPEAVEEAKRQMIETIKAGLDETVIGGPVTAAQIAKHEAHLSDHLSELASRVLGRPVRINVEIV